MPRFLIPLLLSALSVVTVAEEPAKPTVIRVLTPDGKPAAGATVWVYLDTNDATKKLPEPTRLTADADGKVTATLPAEANETWASVFARDAAGRVGGGQPYWLRDVAADESAGLRVVLFDVADRDGRATDPSGKPIAGAVVMPRAASTPEQPGVRRSTVPVPPWERESAAARTDADGRFTLKNLPAGHGLYFKVSADGFGETWYDAPPEGDLNVTHAPLGCVRVSVTGVDPAALKGVSYRLAPPDRRDGRPTKVTPRAYSHGLFDGKPELVIPNVVPGRYVLTLDSALTAPAVPGLLDPFEVKPREAAAVKLPFGPAAKVSGKVIEPKTGQGVAGAKLVVQHRTSNEQYAKWLGTVETNADGGYTAYGPAGWFTITMQSAPDGYAVPPWDSRKQGVVEPAQVELGKSHAFADVALPRAVTFTAKFVLADGKPAAGTSVEPVDPFRGRPDEVQTAGADGTFAAKNQLPDEVIALRARLGKAVNIPATFDLTKHTEPETIELSEANAAGFRGRVTTPDGKPVAGAKVELYHHIRGVGRNSSSGFSITRATARTDADGRFEFLGLWPKDRYDLKVSADGHRDAELEYQTGEAGKVKEVGPFKLTPFGAVAGVVVGEDGKPVAGATVFGVDGPQPTQTQSGPDGKFTLSGYYDAPGFVFARKDGHRLAALAVTPGPKPVTLTLRKADSPPRPAPVIPPGHAAAEQKFLRHLLQKMWDTRAEFDYGSSAVSRMARIDPAAARKWVAEEKARTDGKTNWEHLVAEAEREKTLFDTAKDDVEEALAALQKVKGDSGFYEVHRLGRRLLGADRAKAARVAEEAVVRARQLQLPNKVYMLAQAGELAARAGNSAGGEKIIREAAALAEKLSPDDRDRETLARGMTAARLAPFDWPAAKKLLDPIKDPSEFNRYLMQATDQIAQTDPAKAKELFDLFRPSNSFSHHDARLFVAYRAAKADPDEAEKIIDGVPDAAFRFKGYVRLAGLVAAKDKPRAVRLIDKAMDLFETDASRFESWTHFGGRAGFALLAVQQAKEIDHPDLAGLVDRMLALRPTAQDSFGSPDDRENYLVQLAAGLALIDPQAARQVLAGVAPPGKYVEKALTKRREWLMALALADPERAVGMVDQVFEKAKAGGGARTLSQHGILEVGSILTAAQRYHELAGYASLIREYREPE